MLILFKEKKYVFLGFLTVLIIGLFFRTYQVFDKFEFAHDGDLYSWVVRDIVDSKHLRLIGQVTSTPGIFIGPLFYYALIPFFVLNGMDPVGGIYMVTILSVLTMISFFYVFTKLFDYRAGLIAMFLQAVLYPRVSHDRWVVPTVTTSLWEIWFFYVVVMLYKGNFNVLWLAGILIGLIWHINFSLAPICVAMPAAIYFSKKFPSRSQILWGLITLFIVSIPLLIFEFRHNFQQTTAFLTSFITDQQGGVGVAKLIKVLEQISSNVTHLFFHPLGGNLIPDIFVLIGGAFLGVVPVVYKIIPWRLLAVFYIWLFSVIGFFSLSTKIVTHYYFSNLNTLYMAIATLCLYVLWRKVRWGGYIVLGILSVFLISSGMFLITNNDYNRIGYKERKAAVRFIAEDSKLKGYPCISVSYIADRGNEFGYRYFMYIEKLHLNRQRGDDIPNYILVIPEYYAKKEEVKFRADVIGVILPKREYDNEKLKMECKNENTNLTDPMFGYTQ